MAGLLRTRVLGFIRRRRLFAAGDHVLIAVSGGVDSMVLLHLLNDAADELGIEITAAHFDHGMRAESTEDADWLAGVCAAWGVRLIAERTRHDLHGETAARRARYAFLARAADAAAATRIATAHHADDQIETVLFRILRGTGVHGLAGIPVRRGPIVRPLLRSRKIELVDYATAHDLGFREDITNESDAFARNRIRRAVIPVLQTVRPQAPAAILSLARHAARAERSWRSLLHDIQARAVRRASDVSELAIKTFLEYDPEIRGRLLRAELRRFGYVPGRQATRSMLQFVEHSVSGASYAAARGIRLDRAYDVVRIARTRDARADSIGIPQCGSGMGAAHLGGKHWRVEWTTSPITDAQSHDHAQLARFDCDALRFPLEVRGWRPGERMRLAYGTKKLKKLFAEARVAFPERAAVPILVDADGRVCWMAGVARSIDALPRPNAPTLTVTVTHETS